MNSTDSPYKILEGETYDVIDSSSDSYNNQKNIDYLNAQAEEYSNGDKLIEPTTKSLILGPNQNGSGQLKEYRILINSKGYRVKDYNEINAIKKIYKYDKYKKSNKDYLIICNNNLYKGCKGKINKIYKKI